jgi:hypothetical protein
MKFNERNPNFFLFPPFFVSMATVAKFVQLIPIVLANLVPLDVDVVPIKFHLAFSVKSLIITSPRLSVGWRIAILRFFFTIIILPHIFVCSISRSCLDQTLWNLVGISKKKRRIAIRHPTESRGDVIMSDLTLKAKSSTTFAPNKKYFHLTSHYFKAYTRTSFM